MTKEEIDILWHKAMRLSIEDGDQFTRYRFAELVAAAERTRLHDKFMEIHKSQQHSNNYWHFAARKIKEEA